MNAPKRKIVIAKRPSARRVPVFAEDEPPTTPWNRPRHLRVDDRPTVRPRRFVPPRSSGMVVRPVVIPALPPPTPAPLPAPVLEPERPSMVEVSRAPVLPPEPTDEPTEPRRPAPRWSARIAVVVVIVATELWVAHYGNALRLPDLAARAAGVLAGD
jgi:hypothetical protein